jgi:hypothetical protein
VIIMLEDHDELDQQTTWDQLSVIVNCLIFAKDTTPMVVIHEFTALKSRCLFMKKYAHQLKQIKISYCVGDVLDPTTLQGAGCHTCTRILTLAPSAPKMERSEFDGAELVIRSDDKKDESNILLMMLFEEYKTTWKISNTHIIFDWYSPTAMNLLPVPKLTERLIKKFSASDFSLSSLNLRSVNKGNGGGASGNGGGSNDPSSIRFLPKLSSFDSSSSSGSSSNNTSTTNLAATSTTSSMRNTTNNNNNNNKGFSFSSFLFSWTRSGPTTKQVTPAADQGLEDDDADDGDDNLGNVAPSVPGSPKLPAPLKKASSVQMYVSTFDAEQSKKIFLEKKQKNRQHNDKNKKKNIKKTSDLDLEKESKKKLSDAFSDDSSSEENDEDEEEDGVIGENMSEDDLNFAKAFPRANILFAAGYSIPKSFIAALSSMAYYTPGFLELIEALLNPSEYDQKSIPYLIKIPSRYVGKEYRTIAHELQMEGTLPLGLLRPGGIDAGTPYPYVVTLVPSSNLVMSSEDRVYVLAEPSWIQSEGMKLDFVSPYHKALTKKVSSMFTTAESPMNRSPNKSPVAGQKSFNFDRALPKKALETNESIDDVGDSI